MLFLDDADKTHIFKGKGKLNRIIKNHPVTHVTFSFLWNPVPFCKVYPWGKDIFALNQELQ